MAWCSPLRSLTSGARIMMRLPCGQGHDGVDDLLHRLLGDLPAALGAVGMADAGEEQPQVVVDLGDGAHGRARVAAGALLVDGDGRATGPRCSRHPASPSGPGTGGRRRRATRHNGAALRRRWCRRPASSCPSRRRPVMTTSLSRGMVTSMFLRLCSRAPLTKMAFTLMGSPDRSILSLHRGAAQASLEQWTQEQRAHWRRGLAGCAHQSDRPRVKYAINGV